MAAFALCASGALPAEAHTPHVDVARVQFGSFSGDLRLLLAVVRENLWASVDDARSWRRLWRGLPYARVRDVVCRGSVVVAATDAGLFRTDEWRGSWRRAEHPPKRWSGGLSLLPKPHPRLRVIAGRSRMVCLADGDVLLSEDEGRRWRPLFPDALRDASAGLEHDGAWWFGFADGAVRRIGPDGALLGEWRTREGEGGGAAVTDLAAAAGRLFAATDGEGVWRLDPGGAAVPAGLPGLRVTSLAALPGDPAGGLAAAAWREGVFVSADGGGRWARRQSGLTREPQADREGFLAPQFRQVAARPVKGGPDELFVAGFDGLFRSGDLGRRWRRVPTGVTTELIVGLAPGPKAGVAASLYGGGVRLACGPDGGPGAEGAEAGRRPLRGIRTFAAARAAQPDGRGELWVSAHDTVYALDPEGAILRQAPLLTEAAAAPSRLGRLRHRLLPAAKGAVARLPTALREPIRAFVVGRGGLGPLRIRAPAFGAQFAVPAGFERSGVAFMSAWRSGLFRTDDHGRTFRRVWRPEGGEAIHDVALSPAFERDGVVVAATEGGLRVSLDAGERWRPPEEPGRSILRVALAADDRGDPIVFASTWSAFVRGRLGADGELRSLRKILDRPDARCVIEIAPAPDFPTSGLVLINVAGEGLLRSSDGGARFAPCLSDADEDAPQSGQMPSFPDSARTIAYSSAFAADGVVWAASGPDLRQSCDRGLSWRRIGNLRRRDAV
jgi:hypothetical protein